MRDNSTKLECVHLQDGASAVPKTLSKEDPMRPRGIVRLYGAGRLIWEGANLFVTAGLPALANLIAGVTAGQYVTAMGFGSGATLPAATDVGLTTTPTYYNAIGAHSFPSSGSVQFAYSLL